MKGSYKKNKVRILWWFDWMSKKDMKKRSNRLVRRESKKISLETY